VDAEVPAGAIDDNAVQALLPTMPWANLAPIAGDFNHDGSVDAADYVVWRKFGGFQASYGAWRANFGSPAATGS